MQVIGSGRRLIAALIHELRTCSCNTTTAATLFMSLDI